MYYSKKRKYSGRIVFALICAMLLAGCGNTETVGTEVADIIVDMQQADVGTLTLQSSFVGTVSPQESVYVIPFASGTVTEVNYNVGDYVNVGDVLFKIDDEGARMQLQQAQLSAESAREQVNMATGSQQESTDLQLQASIVQARSGYEQAQIAYFQVKDSYEELDDTVEQFEELVENFEGAISSGNMTVVNAMLPGILASLPKDTNTTVSGNSSNDNSPQAVLAKAKTQLATLQTSRDQLHNSFLQAASAYRAAEDGLKISEDSIKLTQGQIRQDTNEQTKTSLQLAQIGVESAELALSYYTVTAPISGVVQSRSVEVNGIAGQSSPAFVIANENTMQVTFQVSESVKNTLKAGDTVTVERNGQNFEGTVTEVGVAVNQQTGLFQVKANINADGGELPAGVSVKLTADTYSVNNVILIPYDAVYYDNTGAYVYLCVDGKAVKTYVTTGIFDDTIIAVIDGISKGDIVITSWSPRLLDGVSVKASDAVGK
ncbi:MAG: efflux RND transporter periplasmic adaptor subunit [Bacteroidales bacterium]|nr:efflux RND transporter periplasmic adaptor subunit [Lachnoclostridium sp.]MCM1384551.1 efflux RND transporter periplasmic adaptor subunit [Lachnoclostridium sp.]MCM1465167.1 efflux RND transporter periplasmic adaptor subunit [Bacteroidales bacterium]